MSGHLLGAPLEAACAGIAVLADELERQGVPVARIDWRPPLPEALPALERLAAHAEAIGRANDLAVARLQEARPLLAGVSSARAAIPEMSERTILHAGPPLAWDEMSGPMRGAVIGAALYEGLASTPEEAIRLVERGELELSPCHEHDAVGPMAGVVSASMPVWIVENEAGGNRACCTLNEGLGRVLRYGAFGTEVLERLHWMERVLAPVLRDALAAVGTLDLRALIAQAIQMGDDGHNRNRAGTSLLVRELAPALVGLERPSGDVRDAVRFIAGNDHFFLNLTMPAAKVTMDAAAGIPASSIVTAMARNGTTFGLRASGTGSRWFVGPAGIVEGLYLPGFGPEDANRDIGDSAITETAGIGAFVMAGAPAIVRYVGGSASEALQVTRSMGEITWSTSEAYQIPALDFEGAPVGIDCRAVCALGLLPVINTGIAHREAGVGQVGAGIVRPPAEVFVEALEALAEELGA